MKNLLRQEGGGASYGCLNYSGCHTGKPDLNYFTDPAHNVTGAGEKFNVGNFFQDGGWEMQAYSRHDLDEVIEGAAPVYNLSCSNCHTPHRVRPFCEGGSCDLRSLLRR